MSPFKKSVVKGGSNKGKEPVIDVDNISPRPKRTQSPTGVFDLNKFKSYTAFQNYENYFCEAPLMEKGLLSRRLFLKQKSQNGLQPRIRTTCFPTLMMHTRTW